MPKEILFVILGLAAGTFSGVVGLGGGVIIVPALVFLFGLTQQQAQGTTLALMVPPIGYVDLKIAGLICIGFIFGSWFGAKIAVQLPKEILQKIFGIVLLMMAIKMFFAK